jgi:hypothetical protein
MRHFWLISAAVEVGHAAFSHSVVLEEAMVSSLQLAAWLVSMIYFRSWLLGYP